MLLGLCADDLLLLSVGVEVDSFPVQSMLDPQIEVLPAKPASEVLETFLEARFHHLCCDPSAPWTGLEESKLAFAFNPHLLLFRGRAWAQLATWTREMLRVALRLRGPQLDVHGAVRAACRCIVGFSQLKLLVRRPLPTFWEPCD